MNKLKLIKLNLCNVAVLFCYFLIMRLVFLFHFLNDINQDFSELIYAFYLGMKFDLRVAALFVLPTLIIIPLVNRFNPIFKKILNLYYLVISFVITTFYVTDFGFNAYLKSRISSSAFKFFENPLISLNMVWQSYPVVIGFFIFSLISLILYRVIWYNNERFSPDKIKSPFLNSIGLFFILLVCIYGKFSFYPLRWSEAFFSSNDRIGNFAMNPIHYFVDSLRYTEKPYSKEKALKSFDLISDFLNIKNTPLDYTRVVDKKSFNFTKPNIVFIVMESMASNKTSVFDNELDPTPVLKELSKNAYFFDHFFTPTEATARSVFASMTGIPDVSSAKFKSSSRNPFTVNQHLIMNEFTDYEKYYFLGGSANWGNIRGVFTNNVKGINIFEEGNLKSKRVDVWGVSDLDLFVEASQILEKETKPFFVFLQSSGFHRPYTIPEKRDNFKVKPIEEEMALQNGFRNSEEYNSIRFQDYALGEFIKRFKKTSAYKNSIIVIIGDHGLPSSKSTNLRPGFFDHQIIKHHVPLIIHSPLFKEAKRDSTVVSQLDLMPSIAHLAGIKYKNTTLGRSVFDKSYKDKRYSFMYSWHTKPRKISLIDKEFFFVDMGGKKTSLYLYNSKDSKTDVSSKFPKIKQKMQLLTEGLYQTSKYMLYHNKK
jgi:phosphoglycerol transferase MdoB-like AlkP superfamily enzyme